MIVQIVKFKSALNFDEAEKIMKEREPRFRAQPGLLQKYYGVEKGTGEMAGIYLWDSEESLQEFRKSELAKTIPHAYQAQGAPRIEVFDVVLRLRE